MSINLADHDSANCLKTIWAFRAHQYRDSVVRIFKKLSSALPPEVPLVFAWNYKSRDDQPEFASWRDVLATITRKIQIVTLPDDEIKRKYPIYEEGWKHGQIHLAEIGARLHFDFDHLWVSDHDLDFSGEFKGFWEIVKNDPRDHLTTRVRHFGLDPNWGWWPVVPPEKRHWRSFLPIVRCSRRLLLYLEKSMTDGNVYFCEAMLPTETVAQFGELALGEIPVTTFQHKCFRFNPHLDAEERARIETTKEFRWWHPVKE